MLLSDSGMLPEKPELQYLWWTEGSMFNQGERGKGTNSFKFKEGDNIALTLNCVQPNEYIKYSDN